MFSSENGKNQFIGVILFAGIVLGSISLFLDQNMAQSASGDGKKEIPKITFKNVSPPYTDYNYFQCSKKYFFHFNETSFNLVNAWWLAEASTLVYADEDFVRNQFQKAGLPEVIFFNKKSTQCYVANNNKFAIVAFRGSEIWKRREHFDPNEVFADLKTNIAIRLTDWEQGGKVHRGFKKALDEVWLDLLPYVRILQDKGCKIWVTGHSLGGALATLFACRYGNTQGVYTFGSPRVGNAEFGAAIDVKIYRIVNNADIVPRVPPPWPYVHVGELKFIDSDGILRDTMNEKEPLVNGPCDEMYSQESTNQLQKKSFAGFVPASFRDHVPVLYCIHLWNNIIESQQ